MHWSGNDQVGEGRMTISESVPAERIKFNLDFIRPFEDHSTSEFTFRPEGDKTVVTWTMMGKNNFAGRIFCTLLNMEQKLGDDFSKGLASLKSVVEGADKK